MKFITTSLLIMGLSVCLFAQDKPAAPVATPTIANVQPTPHHSHKKLWITLVAVGAGAGVAIALTQHGSHQGITSNIPPTPGQNGITVLPGTFK